MTSFHHTTSLLHRTVRALTGRWPVRHRGHLGGIDEMGRGSSLLGFRRGVHLGVHHGARHGQASKGWPVVQNHVHCATFHHISNDAPCQTHVMIDREVKARSRLMPSRGRDWTLRFRVATARATPALGKWKCQWSSSDLSAAKYGHVSESRTVFSFSPFLFTATACTPGLVCLLTRVIRGTSQGHPSHS